MKTHYLFIWLVILPFTLQAQYTWERYEVSATGGQQSSSSYTATTSVQHYEANQNSNSTYTGNTGFLVPEIILLDINLEVHAFLEGPFNGTSMNSDLNAQSKIPLLQPYNTTPWNYSGSENVPNIPNHQIVDWILVELRDAIDASSATPANMIDQQAAFLLDDGSIVALDGSSILTFNHSIIQSLFVVVHHRNHLKIMSANALSKFEGVYTYDFTTDVTQAYLSGEKLVNGKAVMYGGDANADGTINETDANNYWSSTTGQSGYIPADANMNSQANNQDKNDVWLPNVGESIILPE